MEWTDEGLVIGARRHGEAATIVELLTPSRGRHLGLVRSGRSSRMRSALQVGNSVRATWRARLEDHLGLWTIEPLTFRAAEMFDDPVRLGIAQVIASHARLLAEREPHPDLYARILDLFDETPDADRLPGLVQLECDLLAELGFGLDLSACAATGSSDDLVYVSPKSGRAVSRQAGAPYDTRLLALPSFLVERVNAQPSPADLLAGFRLTGFFLDRHIYGPRQIDPPIERGRLMRLAAADDARAPVAAAPGEG